MPEMLVVDASAIVAAVTGSDRSHSVVDRLGREGTSIVAPELLDIEVAHALRRWIRRDARAHREGAAALERFRVIGVERYGHELLLARIWELRDNLSAYDAAYVALAEGLDAPLLTLDASLARAPGHRARVEVI